jgi:predicted oxidoreductase
LSIFGDAYAPIDMKHYDYIFTGAGLAALMTVYKMVQSGNFKDKSILLLDQKKERQNLVFLENQRFRLGKMHIEKMGFGFVCQ